MGICIIGLEGDPSAPKERKQLQREAVERSEQNGS